MPLLRKEEIDALLVSQPQWRIERGKLVRDWAFGNFSEAMAFVNKVAEFAEHAGHHPDIDIRYNRVQLGLVSHDAGGISDRDAGMAATLSSKFP